MAKNNTAEIGFENQIWEAADVLRGNMDASEYKHVVLGLIFLKYISDKFEERYEELVKEGDGFEEDIDEYTAENIFFVPEDARWNKIAKNAHKEEIGVIIDEAMRSIEKENHSLKGILPKTFARPDLNKQALGEVVDLFTNIQMSDHGDKNDILGRTYEYCLSKFAENEGKKAGEFYTPASVVKTLVEILKPYDGRVYDPCCGSGGMFVQSKNFIENHHGNIKNISVYGQDSNPTTWKMAKMNLAIRGIEADLGEHHADTFLKDIHKTLKSDFILANPPFNMKKWGGEKLQDDPRWKYGMPPKGNANYAWIQHMIYHLAPNGKLGIVLANGSLSTTGREGKIRENIIKADLIEGIVALPTHLFYTTNIPVCLWIINMNKKQKGKTLFLDAREMGTMASRTLRELTDEDIKIIGKIFENFENGELEEEKGFSSVITTEEISKHNYILTPGLYVGFKDPEDDGIPYEEKMDKLTKELIVLFNKSKELDEDIKKSLGELRYNSKNDFGNETIKTVFGNIPKDWKLIYFKDILKIRSEKSNDDAIVKYSVTNTGIHKRDEKFNKQLAKSSSKFKIIYKNDLVFGMSREILNFGVMKDDIGGVSSAYNVFKIDDSIDPHYLELFIRVWSEYFKDIIKPASREGQGIDKNILFNKQFYLPAEEYLLKFFYVLDTFKEKIRINEQINKNLEDQGKNIFNEWVFKFELPD